MRLVDYGVNHEGAPSANTSFKPPSNTGWGSTTIGSILSARALKFQPTPSNTATTTRQSDAASSTFLHVQLFMNNLVNLKLRNRHGLMSLRLLRLGAPASIGAVVSSGAWTKSLEVPTKENGMVRHDVPSELR